jgi:K+-sensing histidine kinase KdpD
MVSHDLRTPLTSIIAAGTALDSPTLTDEERHQLSEAVVAERESLSRLVENLLETWVSRGLRRVCCVVQVPNLE